MIAAGTLPLWTLLVMSALVPAIGNVRVVSRFPGKGESAIAWPDEMTAKLQLLFSLLFTLSFVVAICCHEEADFYHSAGCRAVDGHVFALDGSFREFLVDDIRFCAHTVRVCHFVQSRLVAGGEVELAECLAGNWHCCCFVGRFLVGRQGVILDVRFCPSAGGLHLWDERGESPWLLAALLLLLIGKRKRFSGAAMCNARFPNAGIRMRVLWWLL